MITITDFEQMNIQNEYLVGIFKCNLNSIVEQLHNDNIFRKFSVLNLTKDYYKIDFFKFVYKEELDKEYKKNEELITLKIPFVFYSNSNQQIIFLVENWNFNNI